MKTKNILFTLAILSVGTTLFACEKTHTHNLEKVDAVAATCIQEGQIEHYHCLDCDKLYEDEAGKNELQTSDLVVSVIDHEYKTETVAPTCEEDGKNHYVCGVCGHSYDEATNPKLGHSYGEYEVTWSEDYQTATATRVCANDETHKESETVDTTVEVLKEATCSEFGEAKYSADFTVDADATIDVVVDMLPHTYASDCDEECDVCGGLRETEHSHTSVEGYPECDLCGALLYEITDIKFDETVDYYNPETKTYTIDQGTILIVVIEGKNLDIIYNYEYESAPLFFQIGGVGYPMAEGCSIYKYYEDRIEVRINYNLVESLGTLYGEGEMFFTYHGEFIRLNRFVELGEKIDIPYIEEFEVFTTDFEYDEELDAYIMGEGDWLSYYMVGYNFDTITYDNAPIIGYGHYSSLVHETIDEIGILDNETIVFNISYSRLIELGVTGKVTIYYLNHGYEAVFPEITIYIK